MVAGPPAEGGGAQPGCGELEGVVARIVPFVVAALAVLLIGVGTMVGLAPRMLPTTPSAAPEPVALRWAPPVALPPSVDGPQAREGASGYADEAWVVATAEATGIPARALAAYAGVAIWKSGSSFSCGLTWTTLAAIGEVESNHGRHGGSSIGADGRAEPPIFGVALDGNGVALIPDSDGGEIDGDTELDRAVGPMQLIPQAWRNWHIDGNMDGIEDPHNIDDAVMAAANYLCRASSDVTNEPGWRAAIGAYNPSAAYVQRVADVANRLADDAGVEPLP